MNVLVVYLCFLLQVVLAQNGTLKDVTLEWKFAYGGDPMTSHVESSNDLSEHLPEIYLKVTGVVPTIYAGVFRNIEKLHSLTISDIGLNEIQAGAFQDLPHLENIVCKNNNISEIRSGIFVNLNVSYLQLKNNKIEILEKGAFEDLPKLTQLILENNQLETIGKGVFNNLPDLYDLDLSNNLISNLEAGVFDAISGGEYYSLSLMLNNNKLKEVDPGAFSNKKILTLELHHNEISQLRPGDLKNMPKLYTLRLSNNQIKSISDNTLPATLETIDLSNNQISHISSHAFDGIKHLKTVSLSHNRLTKWDTDWFPGSLTGESTLQVTYNYIEEIPDDAFKNIPEIWILDFSKNRIGKISPDAFKSLRRVQLLSLNDNDIEEWDEKISGTRDDLAIAKIYLRRNRFQCFERDLKEIFKNVQAAWVQQNPMRSAECSERVDKYTKGIEQDAFDKFYDA